MEVERIDLKDYGVSLTLVRHGEDEQDKMGGWSDNHLTEKGILEVKALAETLVDEYDLVVASDLNRAKETAQIIMERLTCPVVYNEGIRETNNGVYRNMLKSEFVEVGYKRFSELKMDESYGGGESPNSFYLRVRTAFMKILEENRSKRIMLVTHGGVIKVILCMLNGTPYSNYDHSLVPKTGTKIDFKP